MIRPYHDSYILAQSAYNIKEVLGKAWVKGGRRINPLVSLFHPALKRRGYQASRPLEYAINSNDVKKIWLRKSYEKND